MKTPGTCLGGRPHAGRTAMTTALLNPTEVIDKYEMRARADRLVLDRFEEEADRRYVYATVTDKRGTAEPFRVADRADVGGHQLYLITTRGWQYYSSRVPARYRVMAWLYGTDDAGQWARRVPATATTVQAAIEAITPAVVSEARRSGRRVLRQGDIYAVETTARYDGAGLPDLPTSHVWHPDTRYLVHRPDDGGKHRPTHVSFPCRFVLQLFGAASFTTD
jgi:hypothetical protein